MQRKFTKKLLRAYRIDLTGKKFGKLTVIKFVKLDKKGSSIWKCTCECGKITEVRSDNLRCGNTKSCGKMCVANNNDDKIIINGTVALIPMNNWPYTYAEIDADKVYLVKGIKWNYNEKTGVTSIKRKIPGTNHTTRRILLSRLIMNVLDQSYIQIDHKNGNKLLNKVSDLEFSNPRLNCKNRKGPLDRPKWVFKFGKKFKFRITSDGVQYTSKQSYNTIEEATIAADHFAIRKDKHGTSARINTSIGKYNVLTVDGRFVCKPVNKRPPILI